MSGADQRNSFWEGLSARAAGRPDWGLHTFRHVHGNDAYIEFDEKLGAGFRQRAVYLIKDNQLRAEILTTSRPGLELLDQLISLGGAIGTVQGGVAEVSVSSGRSDGKIQIVWSSAMTGNRRLWPVHYDWIGETLRDLRETIIPMIGALEPNP